MEYSIPDPDSGNGTSPDLGSVADELSRTFLLGFLIAVCQGGVVSGGRCGRGAK